jgi:UDP-GlcNAc:undecaprenyl-phosphate GlcNAc-1-phosphate transferase
MQNQYAHLLSSVIFISIGITVAYLSIKAIEKSNRSFLPFLFVKAEKSPTNANLLGGLSLTLSTMVGLIVSLTYFDSYFNTKEIFILKASLVPILIVSFYGYMDDRYEIRARHKLLLQVFAVLSFLIPITIEFHSDSPLIAFLSFIFGLAYINGCNLIDGLDTLFVKVGSISTLGFLALGIAFSSYATVVISLLVIASLYSFYRFNREPAKVYAGEIGGSLLGLLFFIQGNLILNQELPITFSNQSLDLFLKILIIGLYPLAELGITFFRRLAFKQSPFRGDNLHLHHVIKTRFKLTASQTSNFIAAYFFSAILMFFSLSLQLSVLTSFFITFSAFSSVYLFICFTYWKKSYSVNVSNDIFNTIADKPIHIINGKLIDQLYFKYNLKENEENSKAA